jgi:hypothetical protein
MLAVAALADDTLPCVLIAAQDSSMEPVRSGWAGRTCVVCGMGLTDMCCV